MKYFFDVLKGFFDALIEDRFFAGILVAFFILLLVTQIIILFYNINNRGG